MKKNTKCECEPYTDFCDSVKLLIFEKKYDDAKSLICKYIYNYPDSAYPHNLLGIIFAINKNRYLAMRHFRAAYALNPTLIASDKNLDLCSNREIVLAKDFFYI